MVVKKGLLQKRRPGTGLSLLSAHLRCTGAEVCLASRPGTACGALLKKTTDECRGAVGGDPSWALADRGCRCRPPPTAVSPRVGTVVVPRVGDANVEAPFCSHGVVRCPAPSSRLEQGPCAVTRLPRRERPRVPARVQQTHSAVARRRVLENAVGPRPRLAAHDVSRRNGGAAEGEQRPPQPLGHLSGRPFIGTPPLHPLGLLAND